MTEKGTTQILQRLSCNIPTGIIKCIRSAVITERHSNMKANHHHAPDDFENQENVPVSHHHEFITGGMQKTRFRYMFK